MIMATFETRNFCFQVFATTESGCIDLLEKAWAKHCIEYDANPNHFENYKSDVCFVEIYDNIVLRDGSKLEV